jgi:hypothetical protein
VFYHVDGQLEAAWQADTPRRAWHQARHLAYVHEKMHELHAQIEANADNPLLLLASPMRLARYAMGHNPYEELEPLGLPAAIRVLAEDLHQDAPGLLLYELQVVNGERTLRAYQENRKRHAQEVRTWAELRRLMGKRACNEAVRAARQTAQDTLSCPSRHPMKDK